MREHCPCMTQTMLSGVDALVNSSTCCTALAACSCAPARCVLAQAWRLFSPVLIETLLHAGVIACHCSGPMALSHISGLA